MLGRVEVEDFDDGIVIRLRWKPSLTSSLIAALATGLFAIVLIAAFFEQSQLRFLGVVFSAGSFSRPKCHSLSANHRELISNGMIGDDSMSGTRRVCVADLDSLEFQEDQTGPEDGSHPRGLYAVADGGPVCLLPEIDEREADSVASEILKRFPVVAELTQRRRQRTEHFTKLNLENESAE